MLLALLKDKKEVLSQTFGYSNFRPLQEDIIDRAVEGNDSLVIMPTGGGKSLCFQIPALMLEGMAIVVSPLIALMNDQVLALKQVGVPAEAIHSNLDNEKLRHIVREIDEGKIKLLYVSPERLNNRRFLDYLVHKKVSLIAIDEAHCVSIWGNDFRPDYAALGILKETFQDIPFMALTATADKATQDDIVNQLRLKDAEIFISSFERKNIHIEVRPAYQRKQQIIQFIHSRSSEAGIIYCLSRKSTMKIANDLRMAGISAKHYHAGMEAQERTQVQHEFQEDNIQVVCATIAFGMGIDKSNIKWIIHFNMPKNLESYYQEIGRSGRDGTQAEALMFYGWGDYMQYKRFIDESDAGDQFKYVQNAKLQRIWEYVSTSDCRVNLILNYFGEYRIKGCGHCDNCLQPPQKFDGIELAQKAISAVIRSQESLGINLLIDVLRGSGRREVMESGLHKIKTFGAGKDLSFFEWKDYITQLVDKGLLRIDYTEGLRLKSTPLSRKSITSDNTILLRKFVSDSEKNENKKKRQSRKTATVLIKEEMTEHLKDWRKTMSSALDIPSYIILTDKIIEELVREKPLFLPELERIEGFGEKRIKDFGKEIIAVIRKYILTQKHKKNMKGKTYIETLDYIKNGIPPEKIAKEKEVHIATIFSHLAKLYENYEEININQYLEEEEILHVREAIKKSGGALEMATLYEYMQISIPPHKVRLSLAIITRSERPPYF